MVARRPAFSTVEVTVAIILLALTAGTLGRFVASVRHGLRERELSCYLGWEIENARARISTWELADVSVENIARMPFSPAIVERLPDARWTSTIETITEPIAAIQVTLQLQCTLHGQAAEPARLTFWIDPAVDESVDPDTPPEVSDAS
ncbi:MAG: hypothetical protein R3C53_00365 [Pirellulaceae bacterium]